MELPETQQRPTRTNHDMFVAVCGKKEETSSPKLTLCRAGDTNILVLLPETRHFLWVLLHH